MKKAIFILATAGLLTACKKSDNTYQTRYVTDEVEYEYSLDYPEDISETLAERYATFDIANDTKSIVVLMDSLIAEGGHLDFWCSNYYQAMKEVIPYDSILPRLMKLQKHEPSNPEVYTSIAYTYNHLGDNMKAIEYLHSGLEIAPDNSSLWYALGIVTLHNGDSILAINSFQKSLELAKKQNIESQITLSQYMIEKLGSYTPKVTNPISETE